MDGSQLPQAIPPLADEAAAAFREGFLRLKHEVGKVIVGQDEVVDSVIIALAADGHVLLEGVPGLGKTLLVRSLSQALRLEFNRVQFTPDLMPADIIGTHMLLESEGRRHMTFSKGPIFTSVLLADEINRATPKTQSALLEAMAERHVTTGGVGHELPKPFFVLATQNPLEMEGTYPLPEAQLDRFLVKLHLDMPTEDMLVDILGRTTGAEEQKPEVALGAQAILDMRATVRNVPAAPETLRMASRILLYTHPENPNAPESVKRYVRFGGSPRGVQAMVMAGKVRALVARGEQRMPVLSAEDLEAVAVDCLRHRVILNFEGEAEGVDADGVVADAVAAALKSLAGR